MSEAFLRGNGFDTYEEQDRVLMGLSGSVRSGVAVRILQQQRFAVAAAVVRLADTPEEHAAADAAKALAKKLDVECIALNAEALGRAGATSSRPRAVLRTRATASQPFLPRCWPASSSRWAILHRRTWQRWQRILSCKIPSVIAQNLPSSPEAPLQGELANEVSLRGCMKKSLTVNRSWTQPLRTSPTEGRPWHSIKFRLYPRQKRQKIPRAAVPHGGFHFFISSGDARCRASRGRRAQGRE